MTWAYYEGKELGYYTYSNSKGLELSLNIVEEYQSMGLGSKIFKEAMEEKGATVFTATWVKKDIYATGQSINLDQYTKALGQGMSKEAAAFSTWSGIQAKANGLTKTVVKELENGGIEAAFTK